MKKFIIIAVMSLVMPVASNAVIWQDYLKSTLLDHVDTLAMYGFRHENQGQAKLTFVDSIVQLGKYNGSSLLDFQAGFFGNPNDQSGENQAVNWIFGGQLRVDSILRPHIPLPPHWEFARAIEHGPVLYWDTTNDKAFFGYGVGMSFDLNPNTN